MMSDDTKPIVETEEISDILLVLDKKKMKIQAVTGIGNDGQLKTVDPTKNNQNQFMKVDKSGDLFSNFFSNFFSQLKNPTNFSFFKIPAPIAIDTANEMQKQISTPSTEGEQLMKKYECAAELTLDNKPVNETYMENTEKPTQSGDYRYQPEQIDWETMSNLGLSKERLEKLDVLEPLLKGYKTNELVPISLNLGTAITKMDARLSLQPNNDGQIVVAIHGIRKEPQLNFPFFGHNFTKEDKKNLLSTGNMGRIVDLKNLKSGELIPSVISVDRLTNELIAFKAESIKIPDEIKGVKLNEHQKQTLIEGKPLHIEGMISKKNEPFDATVQFNADKRYVEFLFEKPGINQHVQKDHEVSTPQISRTFRGKELDPDQYNQFKVGQTVYLSGLVDKKGKEYNGYIKLDKQTGKTDFSFQNPDKSREQAKPTESHKTQIAVNSEGKTNESTKNIKEPLKSGQKNPDSEKQQRRQAQAKIPTASKGRKV